MSIADTRVAQAGPLARWTPVLRAHVGFVVAELVILVAALALVAVVKAQPGPLPGDVGLTLAWQRLVRPYPWPTALIEADSTINWPLPSAVAIAVTVLVFALWRRWLDIAVTLGTLAAAASTNYLTSLWVQRPRPGGHGIFVNQLISGVYSFPSGHVEHAVAFLGIVLFLTFQVPRAAPRLSLALWPVRLFLLAEIVLMAPSRVLMGEHWPSDAMAGLLYGAFWLLVGVHAYTWAARRWPRLVPSNEHLETRPAD
jgi:undecaprenyl-diphosphatase